MSNNSPWANTVDPEVEKQIRQEAEDEKNKEIEFLKTKEVHCKENVINLLGEVLGELQVKKGKLDPESIEKLKEKGVTIEVLSPFPESN